MSRHHVRTAVVLASLSLLTAGTAIAVRGERETRVPYPEGWRQWTHLKSMAIVSEEHPLFGAFAGLHHVYVNRIGLAAARGPGNWPDGSVLVFDLHATESAGGALTEGSRKFIGVMHRDSRRWASTGGWGFEAFAGDSRTDRVVKNAADECWKCHQDARASGYVFSRYRD